MVSNFFQHQMCYTTVRISIEVDKTQSIGTGFLYESPIPSKPDRKLLLLVSNKHVFINPKGIIQISFNRKLKNGEPSYGEIETLVINDFSEIYFEHPDENVDLACLNISRVDSSNIHYKTLHDSFLQQLDFERTPPSTEVVFVGYPENRFDSVNNLPLIRKGSIASLPQVDFNGKPQIVIDAQVFQGSSGSPVFVSVGGEYLLLGVVSETMIKHAQLQTIQVGNHEFVTQQILGLGIVIKQSKVVELINQTIIKFPNYLHNAYKLFDLTFGSPTFSLYHKIC